MAATGETAMQGSDGAVAATKTGTRGGETARRHRRVEMEKGRSSEFIE